MEEPITAIRETPVPEFLSGGGEMGKLIRSKDWSKTPLGSPDSWPQSLRTTVSLCIASNFPISIAWGPYRVQIYNDGYWPITGDMHPTSMGQDFKECWFSAWPVIGQAFEEALLGQTRFLENQRIFLNRYGYLEETFFTFSFSPILDESGGVGGLFHPVIELTQQTLAERRLNILHAVADNTVNARTQGETSSLILECLKDFQLDLPFVLLYSIAANGKEANLEDSVGIEKGSPLAPATINLQVQHENGWPFTEAIKNGLPERVEELANIFGSFNCGPYAEPPHQALVFSITLPGTNPNNYVLVAGASSRRNLDEKYLLFYELLTASITNALTKARAHDEERKKAEALAEIDKAKTVFFSNISHEFRTPLTLMLGSLEGLMNKSNGEIGAINNEAIETSHRNAMRLLRLVNNLLDFSRIEAGRVQAQYQLTDLTRYTNDLASSFRSVIENAGLIFEVKTDVVIQSIYIDKEMWEKVVLNLLSNAFKYTLKGSITLSLATENNKVLLKVKDTGVGIPENELPNMFQRFHRVQNVVGRTYEGTGIGLSLVKELVKLHGGEISVESKETEGSVFTVSIPTGKSHLPAANVFDKEMEPTASGFEASLSEAFIEEATTLIEHNGTGNEMEYAGEKTMAATVLVVDDNADMRTYIKNLLQKQYQVVTANNGVDAIHRVKEHSPQLIVSDIMMPVMDGIQLLKAVKENSQTQNIPVILLSARAGEESKIEGYETGADDYLIKPFSAKELLARVSSQLRLVALRKASEANVRNLFMQAPAVIAVLKGPQHTFELANAMYLQLIGDRDVVGKPVREALPELEGFFALLDGVYNTGEPFIGNELPAKIQKENGNLKEGFFNFVYQASQNSDGEIDGILVHGVDVTEQVLARKKIEESEQKFRTVTQSLPQLIWSTGIDGLADFFNRQWYDYTGSTPEQSFGFEWSQYIHPDDRDDLLQRWKTSLHTGEPVLIELRVKGNDAIYKWFNVSVNPVRNSDGETVKWLGALTEIDERRKWEENLRQSEGRFRALVTATSDVVYRMSPDWTEMRELEGRGFLSDTGKAINDWMHKYIHPNDQRRLGQRIEEAVKNKTNFELEHRVVQADGTLGWTFSRAIPILDNNDEIIEWFGAASDVTQRNNIAEALKKSEQHLELLSDAVPALIFYLDSEQRYKSCNETFCQWFNVKRTEVIGKTVLEFIGEDAYKRVLPHLSKAYAGNPERYEIPAPARVGLDNWLSIVYTPHKNEEGQVLGIIVHATDITQSKQIEFTLRESEGRFRSLADDSPMFVFIIEPDAEATINYWNKTWLDYTGQTAEAAAGRAWNGIIHPDDIPVVLESYVPQFEKQEAYFIPAVRVLRYDGEYRWHSFKGTPRYSADGSFNGFIGIGFDIHEQKLAEEKLAYRTALLEAHNQASVDGILLVDAKGKIISYNQRFIEIWNMPQNIVDARDDDAALSFAMSQLVYPQQFIDKVKYLYDNPTETSLDELEFKDGKIVERNGYPVIGEGGVYYAWSWTFKNITERKKIEQDLINTKEQLELTFKNIPAGVYLINQKAEIIYVNEKGALVYGDFLPEDLLTIKDLPSLLKKADELFERYDEDGNYFAAENSPAFISLTTGRPSQAVMLQINRVTKERSWLYVQGAPMLTPDGKVSMVLVTSTDITVQKSTEEKMKESEERFRTLANSIPQLAWMTDAEGWIYWYNQRWYDYTGTTLEEMQGWGWQSVHHPDLVEGIKRDFANSIAKGEPYEDTFLLRSKEGGFRWFLTRAVPIKNKKGEIVQWFGTNTDVSAQRETEEALKFAKEQLELTFRNVPSAIYHFDKTGRIIYLNEKGAHQIGYATVEDVLKEKDIFQFRKRLEEIFTVLDEKGKPLAADQNSAALTFKTGKASEVVSQFINKSGSSFWLLSKSSPLYDEKGELTIVLTTATDITLQKTSEKAIRESEDRFRTMAETLPQMIWVRNMDGTIEFASKSWEDYTGIKDISEAWKVMIHPEDWQPIMAVWKNAFTTGISFQYEARIKNKEGEYRWHYAVGEPVKNEWGKVVKYIGALTDINVQKTFAEKLENLVAERTKELERSNEDLQQFAHVASHDLKEPVRKVRTFGSRLMKEFGEVLPEKAKLYISKMENAADRMYAMIDGVLLYSSLDAEEQTNKPVDLNEVLQNIETDLEVLITQKSAVINHELLPVVVGSPILLYQLFYNLINNSLKFSKAGVPPLISLKSESTMGIDLNLPNIKANQAYEKITLQDSGIGFSPSQVEKVFQTFLRLNSKDKYEGTGLGLALCRKIVDRHNGAIYAESNEGEGAVFTILLPK